MKNILLNAFLIISCFIGLVNRACGQSNTIIINEDFSDWASITTKHLDGLDNPNGIDLIEMQVTNDNNYLFLKFSVNRELAIANSQVNHNISLCIDADNNPSTGTKSQAGYGSELVLNFNGHYAWFNIPTPNVQLTLYELGLQIAPTFTDTSFELAIPRNIRPDAINRLFNGDTIRILIKDDLDGDRMPDSGKVFQYVFDNSAGSPSNVLDLNKSGTNHLRTVSHNVLRSNAWSTAGLPHLEKIVKALDADFYCYQESDQATAQSVKTLFDSWLPLGNPAGWFVEKDGGRISCSKWPIIRTWNLWRKTATLIDLPISYGRDLLLINAHLSCCTNNQSRQGQADEFASFVLDAKTTGGQIDLPQNTPVIFLGDMNLVGFRQQYETILTGAIQDEITYGKGGALDWDSTALKDATPLHIDSNMVYTWRNLGGMGFPPGRLDFQFYTDAALDQIKSFVLQTETMDTQLLNQYNLQSTNTLVADHLPLVVDYSIKSNTSVFNTENQSPIINIYPNPAREFVVIDSKNKIESIRLIDMLGRTVRESSSSSRIFSLSNINPGYYLLEIKIKNHKEKVLRKLGLTK